MKVNELVAFTLTLKLKIAFLDFVAARAYTKFKKKHLDFS